VILLSEKNLAITRRELLNRGTRLLESVQVESPRRNAEWLLLDVLHCSRAMLYAFSEEKVPERQVRSFEAMIERRMRHEPLQYILGYAEFFGLRLAVTPDVLIPRPETELVVEEALRLIEPLSRPRIMDVGTGSGCIPLAIKQQRPEAEVFACDVSDCALSIALRNARELNLSVTFLHADLCSPEFARETPGALDLLVSNPPYVPAEEVSTLAPEVRDFEPPQALFVDDPLYFYRLLVGHAPELLSAGGYIVFEAHIDYARDVGALLAKAGFGDVRVRQDLSGRPRIVSARHPGTDRAG
jgi:release factor glutamine methyltransferase